MLQFFSFFCWLKGRNLLLLLLPSTAAVKSLQSCPTLCDPIDGSPPGFPCLWDSPGKNTGVGCHFLLQCMKVKSEREVTQSCPTLETPWTAAYQAPPSMGFSRQKYWSGVPLPSPLPSKGSLIPWLMGPSHELYHSNLYFICNTLLWLSCLLPFTQLLSYWAP